MAETQDLPYDCRVFPAAGLEPDDGRAKIAEQVRRWRFDLPEADETLRSAVGAAAAYLRANANANANANVLPGLVPSNPTQLAFLAGGIRDVFLERQASELRVVTPALDAVRTALTPR